MTGQNARFDEVVEKIRILPAEGAKKPSAELKLRLYGLYRQALDGDCVGAAPGLFDPVGRLKHEAWARNRGLSRDEAMRLYVESAEQFALGAGVEL